MWFAAESVDELLVLQRALMEARFHGQPSDVVLCGSPILAEMHDRLLDAIIEGYEDAGWSREANEWREWRRFAGHHREHLSIRQRLGESVETWKQFDRPTLLAFLRTCSAPFEASDEELERLIDEVP